MGVVLVTFSFTGSSGLEEFLVASGKDGLFFTGEFVSWGDVADRGVKAHGVIVFDEAADQATGVLETQGDFWADAISFERPCASVRSCRCSAGNRARCARGSDRRCG